MALRSSKLLWLSLLALVLSGGLLAFGVGYLALVVSAAIVSGEPLVGLLVELALPVVLGFGLLFTLFVSSVVGMVAAVVRSVSLPRSRRAATLVGYAERVSPQLRRLGVADRIRPPEPSAEERAASALADLKRRYVADELSESEFEQRVARLVSDESLEGPRAGRERRWVLDHE